MGGAPDQNGAKPADYEATMVDKKQTKDYAKAAERARIDATKAAAKAASKAERDVVKQQAQDKKQATQAVTLDAKTQIMLHSVHDTLKKCDLTDVLEPIAEPVESL